MTLGLLRALGEELRERRLDKGMTQQMLAIEAGCHRNYVSLLERGKKNASVLTLQAIAGALGISTATLILRAERRDR
jgi:transcriptional regulator with XRE-family HTH domain